MPTVIKLVVYTSMNCNEPRLCELNSSLCVSFKLPTLFTVLGNSVAIDFNIVFFSAAKDNNPKQVTFTDVVCLL